MKNIKEVVSALCKVEAGKSQIKVGDMREAVGKLSDMIQKDANVMTLILALGKSRKRKK